MKTLQPIFIQDLLAPVAARVEAKLLPSLQLLEPSITGIHYEFGHPIEIIETLTQKSGTDYAYAKYPLIALFLDATFRRGQEVGLMGEFDLHMAIIKGTDKTYKAKQRDDNNFKPFLYPIYAEFLNQLMFEPTLQMPTDVARIEHSATNRYYWGRSGLYGNEGNIFNDHVDCIEIENLKIKVNLNYCPV